MNDANAATTSSPAGAHAPTASAPPRTLDLALIGNGRIAALVDAQATIVWACFPTLDGDPMFCALVDTAARESARGLWTIELVDVVDTQQRTPRNRRCSSRG